MDVGFVTFWLALLFVLSGCGDRLSGATAAAGPTASSFPTPYPEESAIIADALKSLRPEDRGDLIVFQNGRIYATSPELKATAQYYRPTCDPSVFLDRDGNEVPFPDDIKNTSDVRSPECFAAGLRSPEPRAAETTAPLPVSPAVGSPM